MMMMKSKANSDDEHNERNGIVVCEWSSQVVYELNLVPVLGQMVWPLHHVCACICIHVILNVGLIKLIVYCSRQ